MCCFVLVRKLARDLCLAVHASHVCAVPLRSAANEDWATYSRLKKTATATIGRGSHHIRF